jgi:hypothetical protein
MCGYCTEEHVLNNLKDQVRGKLKLKYLGCQHFVDFYLRESPDFISSLDTLRRSFSQRKLEFFSAVSHLTLTFRGLEILLEQGFTSPAYQKLLKNKLYRDAIAATCTDERNKEFVSATEGLDIEHLVLLYDAETYFSEEHSRKLITLANVLPSCCNLLKHYISWWLMEPNPLDMAEGNDISSQDKELTDEDLHRLHLLSLSIYFSILLVGSCSAGKKILLAISERSPARIPFVNGIDLWLKRIAAVKLYDLEGFDLFLKHLPTIHASSYFYICQIRGFSDEQKQRLLDEANRQGWDYRWLTDPDGRYESW